jgi:sugar-specific transcriptional regulator TrmB
MSLKRILKTLEGFGISPLEAQVYVYLAKAGPSAVEKLCVELRITKKQLYPALKGLFEKGIVTSRTERTRVFSAIAFEEVLNRFMKHNAEKMNLFRDTKQERVDNWRDIIK